MMPRGFTLLPVILAMSIVAAVAFLLNRDNGLNARMITQQGDVERARYAAEAGLQHVNYVVQAAGCGGTFPISSSPVTNANFRGASYSAYSTTSSGSPITLVSTGTYNGATVSLTRNNVYVFMPRMTSVVQPDGTTGMDASLNSDFPDRNYGAEAIIRLYTGKYQPLLKFNLGAFPAGTRVVPYYDAATATLKPGATLSMYQSQGGSSTVATINAHLMTTDWIEGSGTGTASTTSATWNTSNGLTPWPAGTGYDSRPVGSRAHNTAIGWYDIDVTNAVSAWLSGTYPNYGLRLVDFGGNIGDTQYSSSDNTTASQRPKLTLNAQQPCGPGLVADAYITSADTTHNFGALTVADVSQSSPARRILVRFDVSSIPPGTIVKSATLRMYVSNTTNPTSQKKTLRFYYVMQSWTEGTSSGTGTADGVTWTTSNGATGWTAGGNYYTSSVIATGRDEATGSSPLPAAFRQGWVAFDMQPMVQSWVNREYANYGLELVSESSSDILEFDTRENGSGTAPQLVLTFQ